MISLKPERPYFEAWRRRTSRQFAVSGRLSQTAMILAKESGGTINEWRTKLQTVMTSDDVPTLDLLMRIDALLASPAKKKSEALAQGMLF